MERISVRVAAVWLVFSFTVMLCACSDGDKAIWSGTILVEHQEENLPDSVHHVRYALVDEQGNQTPLSSSFTISSQHVLTNIPINTTAMIIEFCAENGEVLDEDVQPIAFTAYIAYSAPRYNPEFVDLQKF